METRPHLSDYYYLLRKRMGLILCSLLATVVLTAVTTFTMKPVYKATASIIIDKETSRSPLTGESLEAEDYMGHQLTFRTHFKVISSRPVLERVMAQLDLGERLDEPSEENAIRTFISNIKANVRRLVSSVVPLGEGVESSFPEEAALAARVSRLAAKIQIEEVRDTRLMDVHVMDEDPEAARNIANTVAETYILYDSGTRLDRSRKILDWLSKELYEMKKKVEDAEKSFLAFKEKEGMFSIEGSQRINVQKIEEMNADFIKARSQRVEVEAKIQELRKFIQGSSDQVKNVPTFLHSELLASLFADLLNAEVEHQRLSGVFRQKHPEVVKVASKIGELRTKIRQQLEKALANAEAERSMIVAREGALQNAVKDYEQDAIRTNRKELDHAILEREVGTNKELYNTLLSKIKQANVTDEITRSNLRLVQPASLPISPVKPKKALNMALSVALGLFTGVALAFFLEYLDQTVHNRDEAEKLLNIPVLGEIPIEPTAGKKEDNGYALPTLLDAHQNTHFSEAFRQLAANLKFSELNRDRGVYLVTSSSSKEGKSTVSLNLGVVMSRLGMRVLVIDTDLRLPTMKKLLGLEGSSGFTDIILSTFGTRIDEGEVGDLSIGDIHRLLEVQERTGTLHYENAASSFAVSFHKGRILDVDWLNRPPETRLGALLVQSGKVSREQADIALTRQKSASERLGQMLLHLGFISVEELAGPLRLQIEENIKELHGCSHAHFRFKPGNAAAGAGSNAKEDALIAAMGNIERDPLHMTSFLDGEIEKQLFHVPETSLWVLPAGRTPPNPAELLGSTRMRVLLDMLRQRFDMVILDSPPVGTVSDASVLATVCDGVILLIKAGSTHIRELQRAREHLAAVQAPIVGAVLNMLDFKRDPYYYGRYYYKRDDYYRKQEAK